MQTMQNFKPEELRCLSLLAKQYPTIREASLEIIQFQSVLSLPKGCEHFISDF